MKRFTGFAVRGMMLVLAAPAAAQDLAADDGDYAPGELTTAERRVRAAGPGELPARFEDASASGDRVLGTMPVIEGADLNLGMLSVRHLTHREFSRRRMDPTREVRAPQSRLPAVSLSVRF